jgi:hypothetical protein
MAVLLRGYGQTQGIQITKAAQGLPASATASLFTVSAGTVLVQALWGMVSTAIQNQACTLSLGNSPTGGSPNNTSVALAASIQAKPIGTLFVPTWASGVGSNPVVAHAKQAQAGGPPAFLCPAGTLTWTTSATNTGQFVWYLSYLPVDSGATVS